MRPAQRVVAARVLRAIDNARRQGEQFPEIGTLADASDLDPQTVLDQVTALIDGQFLTADTTPLLTSDVRGQRVRDPVILARGRGLLEEHLGLNQG